MEFSIKVNSNSHNFLHAPNKSESVSVSELIGQNPVVIGLEDRYKKLLHCLLAHITKHYRLTYMKELAE